MDKIYIDDEGNPLTSKMTLLDWFVGMAMQGLLASDIHGAYSRSQIVDMAIGYAKLVLEQRVSAKP